MRTMKDWDPKVGPGWTFHIDIFIVHHSNSGTTFDNLDTERTDAGNDTDNDNGSRDRQRQRT